MVAPGNKDEEERAREAGRILKGIASETAVSGNSFINRAVKRTHDHMNAADTDKSDRIEYIGTRIGRVLGPVIAVGLVVWFVVFIVRGG